MMTRLPLAVICGGLTLASACGSDGGTPTNRHTDAGEDASIGEDAGDIARDAATDSSTDPDTNLDGGMQPDPDVGLDAAVTSDAGEDAGRELDAGDDAGRELDAGDDAGDEPVALTLTISPASDQRAISPYIYGANEADTANELGAQLVRLGGNALSGYNWEINATNLDDGGVQENGPLGSGNPGAAVTEVLAAAESRLGMAMLTLPMGHYVAGDTTPGDVEQSTDYLTTRFKANQAVKGAAFATQPDTTDDLVYQDEFVNWVMGEAGTTPVVFSLDNEPSLWELVHSSFHTTKATYDDVVNLGIEFSKAAKDVWPAAAIAGPVPYGFLDARNLQSSPDESTKGNFTNYYLTQMATAEQDEGRRLLDYLDVHWFPEIYVGGVRIISDEDLPALAASRIQAPRSLWDDSYREDSWIARDFLGPNETISLIPTLKAQIESHYPGTKLAVSDWYYGGGNDISGALAAADVLGIFGREGVDLAAVNSLANKAFTAAAFRAFLDYDGTGKRFGDTSVRATTDDLEGSSVYASVASTDQTSLVVIAINKREQPRSATLEIAGASAYTSCEVYELTAAGPTWTKRTSLPATSESHFAYTMPAMSVVVLVPKP